MKTWEVRPEEAGERLDRVLGDRVGSRRQARRWIDAGRVLVDGVTVRIASRPQRGGAILALLEEAEAQGGEPVGVEAPAAADLPILFRDRDLLAVDKPSGLPVQATRDPGVDHLLACIERMLRAQGHRGGPFLHHRLDRGTSGVVVLGLSARANRGLSRAFAERRAAKVYLARVVPGATAPRGPEWAVEDRLLKVTQGGITRVRRDPEGKEALTVFRWRGPAGPDGTRLVEARPATGRTHQIRVHLAESACPVLGDVKYGGAEVASTRLMLHAWRLSLPHPVTGEVLTFEAPPPVGWGIVGPTPG